MREGGRRVYRGSPPLEEVVGEPCIGSEVCTDYIYCFFDPRVDLWYIRDTRNPC